MERARKRPRAQTEVEVVVELKELAKEQGWPTMSAYAFDRSGRLLAKAPIMSDKARSGTGTAELKVELKDAQSLIFKVGPEVPDVGALARHQPAVETMVVTPGKKAKLSMVLVKPAWWCWLKVAYHVAGTVVKRQAGHDEPVCIGEVDIYDVDVGYCIRRLPDLVVERLRDAIIDVILDPLPPIEIPHGPWPDPDDDWCGTPPGPRPPYGDVDILRKLEYLPPQWSFARQRVASMQTARTRAAAAMEKMPLAQKRAWLDAEAFQAVKTSEVLYSTAAQFREILIGKFQAFRFHLCWYPWIYWIWWPWCWYSLEKLGTATLQPGGSFAKTVWLSVCRHDTPDLWFVVRQKVSGVERVIYARHPVPCNTYWNHPSGTPVQLVVTDPLAVACPPDPPTDQDPSALWVLPLAVGNYSLINIYGTGAGSLPADSGKIGQYLSIGTGLGGTLASFLDGPFGGRLGLRVLFSPALEVADVRYYRIKYRINGAGAWTALTHEVVRHYSDHSAGLSSPQFKVYPLGPQQVGTQESLFEIRPDKTPNAASDPYARWEVIDATVDLMNGYFDSVHTVPGGWGDVEFKLELFDGAGARVDPATFGTGGIAFRLPDTANVWDTISTAAAATVNPNLVKADPENPAFQAFIFQLRIDNRQPTAVIDEPVIAPSGNVTGPCGMTHYLPTDSSVSMPFQARHPRRFAMYRFNLYRSVTHVQGLTGQAGDMGASGSLELTMPLKPDLLGACDEAAFSENLYLWNMAFNGWSRVGPDASAVRAFAVVPQAAP